MVTVDGEDIKRKLLVNPKRILGIAKKMGADVRKADKLYNDLLYEPFYLDEWFDNLEKMLDLTVMAIMESLRMELRRQAQGKIDVEKHFLRAMMDLKRCTPESIRRAQDSIKRAKLEAKRLEKVRREASDTVSEIESMMKYAKEAGKAWSSRNDFLEIESSIERIMNALDMGNYEIALHMAKSSLEKAKELRDVKPTALRYAAKTGHIVGKLRADGHSVPKEEFIRLNTLLTTLKGLLEGEDYRTALLLAREIKHEAEKYLPSDRTYTSSFVCPVCFDLICPNMYCNTSISPSPLVEETCRTYCKCGTYYHICCIQKGKDLTCVNCYRPLRG